MNANIFAADNGAFAGTMLIFWLVLVIIAIAGMWATFQKAGKPGWAAIIPIYNAYVLLKVAERPGWWLILLIIPLVNVIISLIVSLDIAKNFGKSAAFGVIGLWIFSIIGYLMLGFGDATYKGGGNTAAPAAPAPTAPTPPDAPQAPAA